jgi:hypothetical protein
MVLALYTVVRRGQARALDGSRFKIHDVLFDDQTFALKHLVVNVGRFALSSRRVLVPANALLTFDAPRDEITLSLTREQVEREPREQDHLPMSQEKSIESFVFLAPLAPGVFPMPLVTADEKSEPHLWSARDLIGYSVRSGDVIAGHIEDIVLDPAAWRIRSLVVSPRTGRARKVLLDPATIQKIEWLGATVHTSLTPEELAAAPDLILGPVEDAA